MRDPRLLFERYGRQLLVEGVRVDGQARLAGLCAVLAHDASDVARLAARACARWLVGAGVGRLVVPTDTRSGVGAANGLAADDVGALDADIVWLASPADAEPPCAQFWFAQRDYGASVDIAMTDEPTGWVTGQSGPARVTTLRWHVGAPALPEDAVALGAAAADLVVADALGLEPLPLLLTVDWSDPAAPTSDRTPRPDAVDAPGPGPIAHGTPLLPALRARTEDWARIVAEVEARYPNEACGFVVRDPDGSLRSVVAPNLQDRYHALDPASYPRTARTAYKLNERLIAKAEDAGATLVCIWHSHCDAGAYFSGEDVRCAAPGGVALYPGVAYLVLAVLGGTVRGVAMYHFDAGTGGFLAELPGAA